MAGNTNQEVGEGGIRSAPPSSNVMRIHEIPGYLVQAESKITGRHGGPIPEGLASTVINSHSARPISVA